MPAVLAPPLETVHFAQMHWPNPAVPQGARLPHGVRRLPSVERRCRTRSRGLGVRWSSRCAARRTLWHPMPADPGLLLMAPHRYKAHDRPLHCSQIECVASGASSLPRLLLIRYGMTNLGVMSRTVSHVVRKASRKGAHPSSPHAHGARWQSGHQL